MAIVGAFQPTSNTYTLTVSTASTTAFQVASAVAVASDSYRVHNRGPNDCFLTFAAPLRDPATGRDTGGAPSLTAVIPTSGNPPGTSQFGMWIPTGNTETFRFPSNAWFAAICAAASSATLDICAGEGE